MGIARGGRICGELSGELTECEVSICVAEIESFEEEVTEGENSVSELDPGTRR